MSFANEIFLWGKFYKKTENRLNFYGILNIKKLCELCER
jgi:hypothetical protein